MAAASIRCHQAPFSLYTVCSHQAVLFINITSVCIVIQMTHTHHSGLFSFYCPSLCGCHAITSNWLTGNLTLLLILTKICVSVPKPVFLIYLFFWIGWLKPHSHGTSITKGLRMIHKLPPQVCVSCGTFTQHKQSLILLFENPARAAHLWDVTHALWLYLNMTTFCCSQPSLSSFLKVNLPAGDCCSS